MCPTSLGSSEWCIRLDSECARPDLDPTRLVRVVKQVGQLTSTPVPAPVRLVGDLERLTSSSACFTTPTSGAGSKVP